MSFGFNRPGAVLGLAPFFESQSNIGATASELTPDGASEPTVCNGTQTYGGSVWYEFHPQVNGSVTVTVTQETQWDPVLAVIPYNIATGVPNLPASICADDVANTFANETVTLGVLAGAHYKVEVGGFEASDGSVSGGSFRLSLAFSPDSDGDGTVDALDACPAAGGTVNGCPAPRDRDGDGFVDAQDRCPTQNSRPRDANRDGCLDPATLRAEPALFWSNTSTGIRVTRARVASVLKGSVVRVNCSRHGCPSRAVHARRSGTLSLRFLRGRRLRAGVRLTVSVARSGAIGQQRVFVIGRRGAKSKTFCLAPGSFTQHQRC